MLRAAVVLSVADRHIADLAARALKQLGFQILRVGSRSVAFQGSEALFETAFKSAIDMTEEGATFASEPRLPASLPREVEFVHFARKPTPTA